MYIGPEFQLGQVYDGSQALQEEVVLYRPVYVCVKSKAHRTGGHHHHHHHPSQQQPHGGRSIRRQSSADSGRQPTQPLLQPPLLQPPPPLPQQPPPSAQQPLQPPDLTVSPSPPLPSAPSPSKLIRQPDGKSCTIIGVRQRSQPSPRSESLESQSNLRHPYISQPNISQTAGAQPITSQPVSSLPKRASDPAPSLAQAGQPKRPEQLDLNANMPGSARKADASRDTGV